MPAARRTGGAASAEGVLPAQLPGSRPRTWDLCTEGHSRRRGEAPLERCTASHAAPAAVLCCCAADPCCSNYAFYQVELRGLEPLTPCVTRSRSARAAISRSGPNRPDLATAPQRRLHVQSTAPVLVMGGQPLVADIPVGPQLIELLAGPGGPAQSRSRPVPEKPVARARQWRLPLFSTRVRLLDPYRLGPGQQTWPRRCGSRWLLPAELGRRDLPDPYAIGAHLQASQPEM